MFSHSEAVTVHSSVILTPEWLCLENSNACPLLQRVCIPTHEYVGGSYEVINSLRQENYRKRPSPARSIPQTPARTGVSPSVTPYPSLSSIKSNTFPLACPLPYSHRFHVANLEQLGPSQAQLLSLEAHEALENCDPSSTLDHPSLLGARKSFGSQGSPRIPPADAHIRVSVSSLSGDPRP